MSSAQPVRYKTDFNDVDENGLVTALPGWGGGSPLVPTSGDVVELFDGDANTCLGIVELVDPNNCLVSVRPVWDSWEDAPPTFPGLDDALYEAVRRERDGQRSGSKPVPA